MPENQIPATQTESGAVAGELNFIKPEVETPRIKRRSLKAKPAGLIKPTGAPPPAARELEREAPPLSAEQAVAPRIEKVEEVTPKPAPKVAETPIAPTKTTPSIATTVRPTTTPTSTSGPASSPHGTRPATLYYSSNPRKEETTAPMKTIPTASPASSSPTTAASNPVSRVATSTARPSPNIDYRANVERQTREQKSVGNILSYVVYALIAFFVISAVLAAYGADVIFKRLDDQSTTVAELDQHYAKLTDDLNAKLAATQDTLTQAQAQIARQQDLIVKQQEELNRLIAATNDNSSAIQQEKETRAEAEASLRARVKDLEYRTSIQKY